MTAKQRLKSLNINLNWPEPSRKQMLGLIFLMGSGIASIYGWYQTHLHKETALKQDTVIAAVRSDTSGTRKVVRADLDTLKQDMRFMISLLRSEVLANEDFAKRVQLKFHDDSMLIMNNTASINSLNQTNVSMSAQIQTIRRMMIEK